MNSKALLNQPQKPFWRKALIVGLLLITLASLSGLAYEKWKSEPDQKTNQSALILQQQFIMTQSDAINTNWLRTLNPLVKNVEGRLAWSNLLQQGVMEFNLLPKIANNQHYQLWIYDLVGKDSRPILSNKFSVLNSKKTLIPFSSKEQVNAPFKFELVLKTDGEEISQPLFLAQP